MRIWDIPPEKLCRNHLLGEHREIHAVWTIITCSKKGYSSHPETIRWKGKLKALYLRHEIVTAEMSRRGYKHFSPLDSSLVSGNSLQDEFVDSIEIQKESLRGKGCGCEVG